LLPALAGANLIYGPGMLEMGMTFSFGQLVIDNEIAAMVKRVGGGMRFETELTGVELIKEIGIGGHFLTEDHTLKYLKAEQSRSRIFDRRMRDQWEQSGSKPLDQTALEQARSILEKHEIPPLPEDVRRELARIVKSVE
jgi:trimethylamine---corrinoid protein Co-methyltransferase